MNKIFLLFSWLISSVSYGQQTNESIDIGGVNRTYIQYLPVGFQTSENMPAVILLHGIGDSGAGWLGAGFNDIADSAHLWLYTQMDCPIILAKTHGIMGHY